MPGPQRRPTRGEKETVAARISQKVAVGVVFVAAMFMAILDATIVNVALPTIGRDFGVSATAVDSISIAFLVSLAIFIPASGWLGDRLGESHPAPAPAA
jgi:MFS family permease